MSFDYSKNPTPTWSWYHTNSAVKEGKTFCHLTTTQCLAIDSLNGRQVPVADSQCLQHRDEVKNITTDSCTVCAVVCCVAPGLEGSVCLVRVGTVVRVCVCVWEWESDVGFLLLRCNTHTPTRAALFPHELTPGRFEEHRHTVLYETTLYLSNPLLPSHRCNPNTERHCCISARIYSVYTLAWVNQMRCRDHHGNSREFNIQSLYTYL